MLTGWYWRFGLGQSLSPVDLLLLHNKTLLLCDATNRDPSIPLRPLSESAKGILGGNSLDGEKHNVEEFSQYPSLPTSSTPEGR